MLNPYLVSEHQAWLKVVKELNRLEIDINKEKELNNLLIEWSKQIYWLKTFEKNF